MNQRVLWWVGFMAAVPGERLWWHRLLRPGYVHCWAARRLWAGNWLWLEWSHNGLTHGLISGVAVQRMVRAAHEVVVIRRPRVRDDAAPMWPRFGMLHCSILLGHALGLRGWTPWRLRREVVASGGRVIRPADEDAQDASCRPGRAGAEAASA